MGAKWECAGAPWCRRRPGSGAGGAGDAHLRALPLLLLFSGHLAALSSHLSFSHICARTVPCVLAAAAAEFGYSTRMCDLIQHMSRVDARV